MGGPITKIIIDLDHRSQKPYELSSLAENLRRNLCRPLTVWFCSEDFVKDIELMLSFLETIAKSNPYLIWNIFLETKNPFPTMILAEIRSIPSDSHISTIGTRERGIRIFAIFPWKYNNLELEWLDKLKQTIPFLWHVEFVEEDGWQVEIEELFREKDNCGFLVDFDRNSSVDFIIDVLELILENRQDRFSFRFKNRVLQQLAGIDDKESAGSRVTRPWKTIERILTFDKDLQVSSTLLPGSESMLDMLEWQIRLNKVLQKSMGRKKHGEQNTIYQK